MTNTKDLMTAAGIKPAQLADILGVARQTVSQWRRADGAQPPSTIAAAALRLLVVLSHHAPAELAAILAEPGHLPTAADEIAGPDQ